MCDITDKDKLLDIFFPPRCAICDRVISIGSGHICDECLRKLKYVEEPVCYRCGKEISSPEEEYCLDCQKRERTYMRGFPVFNYVSPVSESLMAFKYMGRQEYAVFYANEINQRFGRTFKELGIDVLVPVPLHSDKMMSRGYNQAELIARELSKLTGISIRNDLIRRTAFTPPQKELTDDERDRNMRRAFAARCGFAQNASALLVDDIYTTGATIEACTRILRELGIKKVYYTSVAIGKV